MMKDLTAYFSRTNIPNSIPNGIKRKQNDNSDDDDFVSFKYNRNVSKRRLSTRSKRKKCFLKESSSDDEADKLLPEKRQSDQINDVDKNKFNNSDDSNNEESFRSPMCTRTENEGSNNSMSTEYHNESKKSKVKDTNNKKNLYNYFYKSDKKRINENIDDKNTIAVNVEVHSPPKARNLNLNDSSNSSNKFITPWKMRVKFVPGANIELSPRTLNAGKNVDDLNAIEVESYGNDSLEPLKPKEIIPLFYERENVESSSTEMSIVDSTSSVRYITSEEKRADRISDKDEEEDSLEIDSINLSDTYAFPKHNHVQQKTDSFVWNLSDVVDFNIKSESKIKFVPKTFHLIEHLIFENEISKTEKLNVSEKYKIKDEIALLKKEEPGVDVLDLYHSVRKSFNMWKNFDNICWVEKYKPMTFNDIFGNRCAVNKLKEWIKSHSKIKRSNNTDSSSEEFIDSDDSSCDYSENNVAIVVGPTGCGKTCAVYMIANELNYNVIEINAASNRNGKRLLVELLEATQSHRVKGLSIFEKCEKNRRRKVEQKKEKKSMSLILIEDADILFEKHDEGFLSALNTLVSQSKRPMIFVVNNIRYPHLNKYNNANNLILNFTYPSLSSASVWLRLVSLLEGMKLSNHIIIHLLRIFKCDLRRCLFQLQLLVSSRRNMVLNMDIIFHQNWISEIAFARKQNKVELKKCKKYENSKLFINSNVDLNKALDEKSSKCSFNNGDMKGLKKCTNFLENITFLDILHNHHDEKLFMSEVDISGVNGFDNNQLDNDIYSTLKNHVFDSHKNELKSFSIPEYCCVIRTNAKVKSIHENAIISWKPGNVISNYCDYLPVVRDILRIEKRKQNGHIKKSNRYFSYLKSAEIYINDSDVDIFCHSLI